MKTTGKKTVKKSEPRPIEHPATRIVLEDLLPFLSLNPETASDDALFSEVRRVAVRLADSFCEGTFTNGNAGGFLDNWKKAPAVLGEFRKTLGDCRKIILSASIPDTGVNLSRNVLWDRIQTTLGILIPRVMPYGIIPFRGVLFPDLRFIVNGSKPAFKAQKEFDSVWVQGVQAIIFYYVTTAYKLVETGRKKKMVPAGKPFIGFCPKCSKIFRKTRANQEFCGVRCKTALIQSRRRSRKN